MNCTAVTMQNSSAEKEAKKIKACLKAFTQTRSLWGHFIKNSACHVWRKNGRYEPKNTIGQCIMILGDFSARWIHQNSTTMKKNLITCYFRHLRAVITIHQSASIDHLWNMNIFFHTNYNCTITIIIKQI